MSPSTVFGLFYGLEISRSPKLWDARCMPYVGIRLMVPGVGWSEMLQTSRASAAPPAGDCRSAAALCSRHI